MEEMERLLGEARREKDREKISHAYSGERRREDVAV